MFVGTGVLHHKDDDRCTSVQKRKQWFHGENNSPSKRRQRHKRPVVLNLFSTMLPLSNWPLFHAPMTINKLYKQMYLLVNLLIKLSMLQSA